MCAVFAFYTQIIKVVLLKCSILYYTFIFTSEELESTTQQKRDGKKQIFSETNTPTMFKHHAQQETQQL